ncbi:MAG: TetR/AcrR family transcriptional regulator [Clostridia bacterium]|nr:TetR/AcrR family transcriptional regulator [Clostridia bacterium]
MNQKNNQRFQETDRRIREYFAAALAERDIGRITVNEICQGVGINRSSFYLHYQDVYALLDAVMEEIGRELFVDFDQAAAQAENYFSDEYLIVILRHTKKHAALYRAYIAHVGMGEIEKGYQSLFEGLIKPYLRRLGIESEREMEYYFSFVQAGFFAVMGKWISYGCAETPEEMVRIIRHVMAPIPEGLPEMAGL